MSSNRQRSLALIAVSVAIATPCAAASAETYGKLVVRHSAVPAGSLETQFGHVRPPRTFVLVVTEPTKEQLNFTWSVHCTGSGRHESGGASGRASVASGHWVKRIPANWIKHPASCSGSIVGTAPANAVLVRVFTT
jgi:hypothetical protein